MSDPELRLAPADLDLHTFFRTQANLRAGGPGEAVYLYLDNLDQKTSALLTHVSIVMTVATLFFAEVRTETPWRYLVAGETLGYMLIALGCLTCVDIQTPKGARVEGDPWSEDNTTILLQLTISIARRRLHTYRTCLIWTIALTAVMMLTFAARVFLG